MFSERGDEMLNLALLIIGVLMLSLAFIIIKIAARANMMSKEPTYSTSVNQAIYKVGIYTEHGMVLDKSGQHVKAESRKSRSYFESFI
ncbi:MAG: hypothetical protein WAT12_01340 [Candidatus Nitrotoga sp.]